MPMFPYINPYLINQPGQPPVVNTQEEDPMNFINQRMAELFQPEHMMSDRVNQMLGSMPQRNNPGIWRKMGASLVGLGPGGIEAADKALYAPYYNQMDDWNAQFKPTYQAASLERYNNANEERAARDQATSELNYRKQTETERKNQSKEQLDQEKLEVSKTRAAAYTWKAYHPNQQIKMDRDGYLIGINPQTGEANPILGPDGIPVKGDKLPEEDKLRILHNYRTEEIVTRGNVQSKLQEDRQANQEEYAWKPINVIGPDGKEVTVERNSKTGEIRPFKGPGTIARGSTRGTGAGGTKGASEFAITRARINRAVEFMADNPDLAQYITMDARGVQINAPDGTTQKMMREYIFGPDLLTSHGDIELPNESAPVTPNKTQQNLQPNQTIPKSSNESFIMMVNPQGQTVKVPMNKLNDAKKLGYKNKVGG